MILFGLLERGRIRQVHTISIATMHHAILATASGINSTDAGALGNIQGSFKNIKMINYQIPYFK